MDLEDFKQGKLILIDKPLTWTSFNAVSKIKWLIKKRFKVKKIKVGHAGTLDPLATGLLIICTGKFTKQIDEYQAQEKEYTGVIRVGESTPSFDLETEVDKVYPTEHIDDKLIEQVRLSFLGEQQQTPPIYSAIKKDGKRLYELARAGKSAEIESRSITISQFDIDTQYFPDLKFRVIVSKGTYIRSLASDFGERLNSGAYLKELRRTKIGNYCVDDAISPEEFENRFNEDLI